MSANAQSGYAADANGNKPVVHNGTVGAHPTYAELEAEVRRLRRRVHELEGNR